MRIKKWLKKIIATILWTIVLVMVLGVVAHFSFIFYFNKKIRIELQEEFLVQTKGEYALKMDRLETNIFIQSVFIKGFSVQPVSGIKPTASKYYLSSANINLENFKLYSFLFKKKLKFESLQLIQPKVTIFRNSVDDTEADKPSIKKDKFSIYKLIKPYVKALSVEEIQVSNSEIKVYANDKDSLLIINSHKNELHITELNINAETERAGHIFQAEKTELAIKDFSYTTPDKLYTIKIANVFASYSDLTVRMDSVQLIPGYSKPKFGKIAGKQTDRISLFISTIKFEHMNVKLFFEKNFFIARHLKIDNLQLNAYRDKNDIRKSHVPLSVQSLINNIPVFIKIDSIRVKNAVCTYEEVAIESTIAGKISFNKLNALITGFSNRHTAKDALLINANCLLMNKRKLQVKYRFPFNTEGMVFDCSGHLGAMPFSELNQVLEPIAKVSVSEGEIESMDFHFHASDVASDGWIKLVYNGLKVNIIDKDKIKQNKFKRLSSFVANAFLIKAQNPSGNKPLRVGKIHYVRHRERFIFNYSLKSLLSGITQSVGTNLTIKITD